MIEPSISINAAGDLVQGVQNEFTLSVNHDGVEVVLCVKVAAPAILLIPEPGRESTGYQHDICCTAMRRASRAIVAELHKSHSIFSRALQAAVLADRSAYRSSVKVFDHAPQSKEPA